MKVVGRQLQPVPSDMVQTVVGGIGHNGPHGRWGLTTGKRRIPTMWRLQMVDRVPLSSLRRGLFCAPPLLGFPAATFSSAMATLHNARGVVRAARAEGGYLTLGRRCCGHSVRSASPLRWRRACGTVLYTRSTPRTWRHRYTDLSTLPNRHIAPLYTYEPQALPP